MVVGENAEKNEQEFTQSFFMESFYPPSHHDLIIVAQPPPPSSVPLVASKTYLKCISVNGVACAATPAVGISVVIVDETTSCILHSKSFSSWVAVGTFLDCIHSGRIVAICGILGGENSIDRTLDIKNNDATTNYFRRLGGFNTDESIASSERFVLFVGQMNFHPDWATSICTSDSGQAIKVTLRRNNSSHLKVRLRPEINAVPAAVYSRLPDAFMSLQTQLAASDAQKRAAFNMFVEADGRKNLSIAGYTTKNGAPIYLIDDKSSYPFQSSGDQPAHGVANHDPSWVTYHFLPESLVPENDFTEDSISSHNLSNTSPKFDVPIADDYFVGLLGNKLLVKNGSFVASLVDTSAALSNSRLVALYFSAHWCAPCRGFTPMLVEFYNHIQDVAPVHGLKLVFISSDRDEDQFIEYYANMSFLALPFSQMTLAQHVKSVFGVRGIPSLVIIDSISGRIVQPPEECRRDVHRACQQGEDAIEKLFNKWLDNVPDETKSIIDVLALSCQDQETIPISKRGVRCNAKMESYLFRKVCPECDNGSGSVVTSPMDFSAHVKKSFTQLVATGMEPNSAAAEAIKLATIDHKDPIAITRLETGKLGGTSELINGKGICENLCELSRTDVINVLTIAKRYLSNVQKDPSNPRFRNFRLGNKVFDQITSTPGGIAFLTDLGFSVFHSDDDFVASIPLTVNLAEMADVFDNLLKRC